MEDLKIVYLDPHDLTPYEGNARKHSTEDVEQIKKSIDLDGFNDPIGIWGDNNLIVEGHGRQLAALQLGMDKVPCVRLDHLTETQRRDYAIRHNRTAELSEWDWVKAESEIRELESEGMDMSGLGFDFDDDEKNDEDRYTKATRIPQYEPRGGADISTLVKTEKVEALISEIEQSHVSREEKEFLKVSAYRHAVIDFDKVADYYSEASAEMQELMERQALVIIDYEDAIANGYATLNMSVAEFMGADDE